MPQGYLRLVFDTRNRSYEDFKPALFNALDDLDVEISTTQITNTFLYMFMSDEIYKYFQDELKKSGEDLGIGNLTIIDSIVLQDRSLTSTQNVLAFISDIKTVTKLQDYRIYYGEISDPQVLPGSFQFILEILVYLIAHEHI